MSLRLITPPQLLGVSCCCTVSALGAVEAAKPGQVSTYNLPRGEAASMLQQFAGVSGRQVFFMMKGVKDVQTNAVAGKFSPAEALARMLAGTVLIALPEESTGGFVISRRALEQRDEVEANTPPTTRPTKPMPVSKNSAKTRTWIVALFGSFSAATMSGQAAPDASAADAANPATVQTKRLSEDVIELSPFVVQGSDDVGYQAANTTSGSRMNTRLKDTAAPISPFTPEFLADIGATGLEDMMSYATNIEVEREDATNGFNNAGARLAGGNDFGFRMRGLAAGSSQDYVTSSIPVDLYNVERAEVTSGPNAVLFGLGDAGGNVALTSKRANLRKARTTISNVVGSWNYERFTLDRNLLLQPGKLALRLNGLYENANTWRYGEYGDKKRLSTALAYRPFKNTTVHVNLENGHTKTSTTVPWNAQDALTAWLVAGSPVADGAAVAGTTRFNANTRYTFVENDNTVYNYRQELQSASLFTVQTLVPESLHPFDYNPVGPGGGRVQDFNSRSVVVEQKLAGVDFELGYFHNKNLIVANSTDGQPTLYGDPNANIPPATFVGTLPNPRAGQLYLETTWGHDRVTDTNDVYRLTAAKEFDLGKWLGRHRVATLLEHSERERTRYYKTEIFVDDNNAAITAVGNPEGVQNQVFRRNYVTPGDYRTYYMGNGMIPAPSITVGGKTYHVQETSRTLANDHSGQSINSYMLAMQSYWWADRFVTTLGYRVDALKFDTEGQTRISDPNDPRILDKSHVLNEWEFDGTHEIHKYDPYTFTAGGVFHATDKISLFFNNSTNKSPPRFGRTILPHGGIGGPINGKSTDFGFMLDLFGDDRYFMRVTHFDTKQLDDDPIIPNGGTVVTSVLLGGDNLQNIYNALLTAGTISQAQFDAEAVNYTSGMADVFSKGYEVEFIANPSKNISLRLAYSYSDRNRANIFHEIFSYYADKTPEWLGLAAGNTALTDTINSELAAVYSKLDDQLDLQSGPLGSRPHKLNVTGRYQFHQGSLKGLTLGGGIRYQSRVIMAYDRATDAIQKGNNLLFGDAFVSYKRKAPFGKGNMTFQLNVRNITNDYLVEIGRRNATGDGIRRVYLSEPRNIRFTTTFEF